VLVEAAGSRAWSVGQWAVANAKVLDVARVEVAGRTWDRAARDGWQDSTGPGPGVRIVVAPPED
jgi:hypothetical protein